MASVHKSFYIDGMTCVNCQYKIEKRLRETDGIQQITVDYSTGQAELAYEPDLISWQTVQTIVEELGYEVLCDGQDTKSMLSRMLSFFVIIISLYVILQQFGLLTLLVPSQLADSEMGYGMLFVTGLLTSVHCVAMCGGIHLSQCIPVGETATKAQTYLPSVLYNLGRVVSYTVVGFILGSIGYLAGGGDGTGVPVLLQGILKLIAGVIMVLMGINMLGLFPGMRKLRIPRPKFLVHAVGRQKAVSKRPFVVGLLNGLMPCGPLQSMQILALASGSPLTGALSMLLFSLGTVPLMLGLGTIVSALGKRFTRRVMTVGAVLVVVLGLAMLAQGSSLSGLILPDRLLFLVIGLSILGVIASLPYSQKSFRAIGILAGVAMFAAVGIGAHFYRSDSSGTDSATAMLVDGIQMVSSTLTSGAYPTITVQEGIPVKWTIQAPEGSINGCNYKMIIQEYGIEHTFSEGENMIEFTPTASGKISYSCWMGMIYGDIYVVKGD